MMNIAIPTSKPFAFSQTLGFVQRFLPCRGEYIVTADSITAAIAVDGKAVPFTVTARGADLVVTTEVAALAERAMDFIGARDDVAGFYTAAAGDRPMTSLIEMLYGLHHVRFLTLGEIAVYSVMMQRRPITAASAMKRKFLDRFGLPIEIGGQTLRAMPELAALAKLDPDEISAAIGHEPKSRTIADVIAGVAELGEDFLREAPYEQARDALLAIRGIGPFSAGAILLRGLGRMDELPIAFADEARELYGAAYDHAAIRKRYGRRIGYWSFYLKTGLPRLAALPQKPRRSTSGPSRRGRAKFAA
jgi:DNA-3-methyladenine glycosylase II